MSWAPIDGPVATAARSTHCSRQRPKWSIVEGETDTGTSAPRRGRSSLTSRSAHHWAGSAPGTLVPARVASAVHGRTARSAGSGPASSRRSSATRPGRVSGRATSVNGRADGRRVDDVEEGRRLLVLAAHRGDDEPLAGPGDRHVEQPGLVVAHLGASARAGRRRDR